MIDDKPTLSIAQSMEMAWRHYQAGTREDARMICLRVLQVAPKDPDALHLLGVMAYQANDQATAINLASDTARSTNSIFQLGNKHYSLGDFHAACECYQTALLAAPASSAILINFAAALSKLERDIEALSVCKRALELDPHSADGQHNLAAILTRIDRHAEAIPHYRHAIRLEPKSIHAATYWTGLGSALGFVGQIPEALQAFAAALSIDPNNARAHFNRAVLLLSSGDFDSGWTEYEWRHQLPEVQPLYSENIALWKGEDLNGKSILLISEGGHGDTIQFVRYAPLLAARGAHVHIVCQPELGRLLTRIDGIAGVHSGKEIRVTADFHCPLLSLPLRFKTRAGSIPNNVPYIQVDSSSVSAWSRRIGQRSGLRVGLVWAGRSRQERTQRLMDLRRSVPLSTYEPLFQVSGVEFYSLQKGEAAESELAKLVSRNCDEPQVKDFTGMLADFADTAALIQNLDLVISVDTATAHLAGALGKPVWVLSRFDACWRWLLNRSDSPWYPTMRIFRQPRPGDWGSVISEVKTALARGLN